MRSEGISVRIYVVYISESFGGGGAVERAHTVGTRVAAIANRKINSEFQTFRTQYFKKGVLKILLILLL